MGWNNTIHLEIGKKRKSSLKWKKKRLHKFERKFLLLKGVNSTQQRGGDSVQIILKLFSDHFWCITTVQEPF